MERWIAARKNTRAVGEVTAGLSSLSAHFRQSLRTLSHVDPPLQLALQFGNVHLVRDAVRVADALP
jgi:hypothetical protein